jgi:hypothetical protein
MKLAEWILLGLVWVALLVLASDAAFNIISAFARGTLY